MKLSGKKSYHTYSRNSNDLTTSARSSFEATARR